jgi:hypothetical protein
MQGHQFNFRKDLDFKDFKTSDNKETTVKFLKSLYGNKESVYLTDQNRFQAKEYKDQIKKLIMAIKEWEEKNVEKEEKNIEKKEKNIEKIVPSDFWEIFYGRYFDNINTAISTFLANLGKKILENILYRVGQSNLAKEVFKKEIGFFKDRVYDEGNYGVCSAGVLIDLQLINGMLEPGAKAVLQFGKSEHARLLATKKIGKILNALARRKECAEHKDLTEEEQEELKAFNNKKPMEEKELEKFRGLKKRKEYKEPTENELKGIEEQLARLKGEKERKEFPGQMPHALARLVNDAEPRDLKIPYIEDDYYKELKYNPFTPIVQKEFNEELNENFPKEVMDIILTHYIEIAMLSSGRRIQDFLIYCDKIRACRHSGSEIFSHFPVN